MFPTPKHVPTSDGKKRLMLGAFFCLMFVLAGLNSPVLYATTHSVSIADDNNLPGSLRFEIENATAGDIISIETASQISVTNGCINVPADITIQSGTSAQVTISGVSISQLFCITGGTVTFADLHFVDAWATGGSVLRASNATVEMNNCVAYNNRATNGSVIYATGSTIIIDGSHFYDNYGHGSGGAIYVYDCAMTVTSSTFATNRAGVYGGAIYAYGVVTVASCQFEYNQSTCAGAAIFLDEEFLDIYDSQFRHNSTEDEGGAILAVERMNVTSSTFEYNNSTNSGGAIRYVGPKLNVSHTTFANNSAGRNGGGLRLTGIVVITSSTLVNNYSTRSGAGIAHYSGELFLHSTQFEDNRSSTNGGAVLAPDAVLVTSCSFVNNYAAELGGALYQDEDEAYMQIDFSELSGNTAHYGGGAIFAGESIVDITSSTVTSNQTMMRDGGGMLIVFGLGVVSNSTFANNSSDERGGAIYTHHGSDLEVYDSFFDGNEAEISGGAVYTHENSYLGIENSTFTNNHAKTENGGAFRQHDGSELFVINSLFDNNRAGNSGGAAKFNSDIQLVTSSTFVNNVAADNGGALRISDSAPVIVRSTFANNSAQDGGAAWGKNSALFFETCDLYGNVATNNGGAVAVETFACDECEEFEIEFGGELGEGFPFGEGFEFGPLSHISMRGCSVTNNSAAIDGGALHLITGYADIQQSLFEYNTSTRNGAVIYSTSASVIEFAVNTIAFNSAEGHGGVVCAVDTYNSFMDANDLIGNTAGGNGGAIYSSNSTITVGWSTIASCTAANNGGAIYVYDNSTTNVTSCSIRGNWSGGHGGAAYIASGKLTATGNTLSSNHSVGSGGAVYNTSTFAANNNTFSGNSADGGGGAVYTTVAMYMTSNTLTLNIADADNNGTGGGGGIFGPGASIRSNIIAGNTDRGGELPDVGGAFTSDGYNLIGDLGNFNLSSNTTGDRYGDPNSTTTPAGGAVESATALDAMLEPLADNGGPTFTHGLELLSPAINNGAPTGLRNRDQRENERYGQADIGSFEAMPPLQIVGSTTACIGAEASYSLLYFSTMNSYSWESTPGGATFGSVSLEGDVAATIDNLTIATLTVTELFMDGSSRATTIAVSTFPVAGQMDYICVTAGNTVTFNVLTNDMSDGLSILQLITTGTLNGTVSWVSSGTVTYTAPSNLSGFETFTYVADGESLCTSVTVNVVIAVKPAQQFPVNLSYVERKKDRSGSIRGLRRVTDVELTADGRYVFAAGWSDHSVVMMERDPIDGTLTYLGRARHNYNGVSKMRYPSAIALSPDETVLYVTSYADHSMLVFDIDYVNEELDLNKVLCPKTGGTQMKNPTDLCASSDGRSVYVSAYGSSAVAHFETYSSAANMAYIGRYVDGVGGVDGLRNAMGVAASPDGKMVYVAGKGDKALAIFKRSRSNGSLNFQRRLRDGVNGVDGLAAASDVAVSPDNRSVYVSGYSDRALAVFKTDLSTCEVSYVGRFKDGQGGVDGLYGAYDVRVSDDGTTVYVVGELDNAIAVFERNLEDCSLTYVEHLKDNSGGVDGLKRVRAVAASNDSRHVYCAGRSDNAVSVFYRNQAPQAIDDVLFVIPNNTQAVSALNNDFDADGDGITISAKTDGAHGTVAIAGGGTTLEYTSGSPAQFDTFTYTIDDGNGGTSTATVNVMPAVYKQDLSAAAEQTTNEWLTLNVSPNPVSEVAEISLSLAENAEVQLSVVNIFGQTMTEFALNTFSAGAHSLQWDARDASGARLGAGTYWLRARVKLADGTVHQRSMAIKLLR